VCKTDPGTDLVIFLGDKDDRVRFKGKPNATKYGDTPHTDAAQIDELTQTYNSFEGENTEHAYIDGGAGNDVLYGTAFHDVLIPGPGKDAVDAGAGDDSIDVDPDGAADSILGGSGVDLVQPDTPTTQPLAIDLSAGTLAAGADTDHLGSIENAEGALGNDTLKGTEGRDGLFGGSGDDTIDGLGGDDYLGGDAHTLHTGTAGVDTLNGGSGDDVLDGRDNGFGAPAPFVPTDKLSCGAGADAIVARQDDLVDGTCESSGYGANGSQDEFEEAPDVVTRSAVQPVARAADGAPTYAIACPKVTSGTAPPCEGKVLVEQPPAAGTAAGAELGSGAFSIPRGSTQNVAVSLNPAGKTALAKPGALAAVHVAVDTGVASSFGWQQQLGP
jgi:hypothetical protein